MNRTLILAAALAVALSTAPAHALSRLGDAMNLGKKAAEANQEITEEEEIELGRGVAAQVLGARGLVQDEQMQLYVNRVGLWLALQSERPDLPWRFGVMDSDAVNAFAMPGGIILITRGLYDRLRDEGELAGVLAHEISHVVDKHQVKAIKKAMGRAFATELAGQAAQRSGNEAVRRFGGQAFRVGAEIFTKGLDKQDEYDADRNGMVLAARGGYNPYGLAAVLQTLDAVVPSDGSVSMMFSTHPTSVSRIERLDETVGERLDAYAGAPAPARIYRPR